MLKGGGFGHPLGNGDAALCFCCISASVGMTKPAVREFADTIGIHPSVVVGRLQHDGLIEPSWMNDLRESFQLIAAK